MSQQPPAVAHELAEEVELGGGQMHLGAIDTHRAAGQVDLEPVHPDRRFLGAGRDPPEVRLQSGDQLARPEWLGHVVVGAGGKGAHLGLLVADGREHDQRHLGPFAQAAAELDAVHVRQQEVHDPGVGRLDRGDVERFLAGAGRERLEARLAQDHA